MTSYYPHLKEAPGFAFLPDRKNGDNRPDRIMRFVMLPDKDMVSMLDPKRNILRISAINYDKLSELDQHRVDRTHHLSLYMLDRGDGSYTVTEGFAPPPISAQHLFKS